MVDYSLLYDVDTYKEIIKPSYLSTSELGYRIINNGIILPYKHIDGQIQGGGILNTHNSFVDGSQIYRNYCEMYKFEKNEVIEIGKRCIFLGVYSKIWGHFITDSIKYVWFLLSNQYERFADYELVYLSENGRIDGNYKRLLEIIGVDSDTWSIVSDVSRFKEILLPDECWYTDAQFINRYTKEYTDIINLVRDFACKNLKSDYKKIYFSYPYISIGERKIQKYLKRNGFKVIYPEKHTLDELLGYLINCDCFASTDGSSAHNVVFLKDGAEAIIIPRYSNITRYQLALNTVNNINAKYVDSTLSLGTEHIRTKKGLNYFYISDNLRKAVEGDGIGMFYLHRFLLYLYMCAISGCRIDNEALKYYQCEMDAVFVKKNINRKRLRILRGVLRTLLKISE